MVQGAVADLKTHRLRFHFSCQSLQLIEQRGVAFNGDRCSREVLYCRLDIGKHLQGMEAGNARVLCFGRFKHVQTHRAAAMNRRRAGMPVDRPGDLPDGSVGNSQKNNVRLVYDALGAFGLTAGDRHYPMTMPFERDRQRRADFPGTDDSNLHDPSLNILFTRVL